mgnify:CR=1 FL=1
MAAAQPMDVAEPMDVDEPEHENADPTDDIIEGLEKGLKNVRIGTQASSFLLQGETRNRGAECSEAEDCQYTDHRRILPKDEIVYIIAAHGIYNNIDTFREAPYPGGHGTKIYAFNDQWVDLNFGVLVSEGTILQSKSYETRQDAVKRHIDGIISGGINVYQRYPWKEGGPHATEAIFPNFIFGEGGGETDPFVATIARYYNGILKFFQLTRSVENNELVLFNEEGTYPNDNPQNLDGTNGALLSQILPIIEQDVRTIKKELPYKDIKKTNVVFATCMEGVPSSIHNIWIGNSPTKPHVVGGKRKKKKSKRQKSKRQKSKRQKSRARKRSHRKRSRTRKR